MRRRLVAASGLASALAIASPAVAAPPWSPPRDISAPTSQIDRPSIDFGADGVALIGWSEHSSDPGRPFRAPVWSSVRGRELDAQFPVRTATALPGAGFGPVSALAASGVPGSVSAARDGRTLVTWSTATFGFARPPDEQTDTFAAVRPTGAPALAPPETISAPAVEDFAPAAAFDPLSGRATAAWPAAVRTPFLSGYEQVRMQLATRGG